MGGVAIPKAADSDVGGFFRTSKEADMSDARLVPARLAQDLAHTLSRLKMARQNGDLDLEVVAQARFDWLVDQLPRSA